MSYKLMSYRLWLMTIWLIRRVMCFGDKLLITQTHFCVRCTESRNRCCINKHQHRCIIGEVIQIDIIINNTVQIWVIKVPDVKYSINPNLKMLQLLEQSYMCALLLLASEAL